MNAFFFLNRPPVGSLKRNVYPTTSSPRRTDRPPMVPSSRPVMAQQILQASREAENALANALVSVKCANIRRLLLIYICFCPQSPDDFDLSSDMSRMNLNRKISRDESDESEASSVCSERSFDSYRRQDVSLGRSMEQN